MWLLKSGILLFFGTVCLLVNVVWGWGLLELMGGNFVLQR